jgi:hypothetical protein
VPNGTKTKVSLLYGPIYTTAAGNFSAQRARQRKTDYPSMAFAHGAVHGYVFYDYYLRHLDGRF